MPGWLDRLLSWSWPSPPDILGGAGAAASAVGDMVGGMFGGNAGGTPFWRGGLTWVGEEGPELIDLPRGTRVFPNDLSMEMAGGGMGGGGVQITVNATVANELDLHELAYRLGAEFERLRR
jgi:hypothetical protein